MDWASLALAALAVGAALRIILFVLEVVIGIDDSKNTQGDR